MDGRSIMFNLLIVNHPYQHEPPCQATETNSSQTKLESLTLSPLLLNSFTFPFRFKLEQWDEMKMKCGKGCDGDGDEDQIRIGLDPSIELNFNSTQAQLNSKKAKLNEGSRIKRIRIRIGKLFISKVYHHHQNYKWREVIQDRSSWGGKRLRGNGSLSFTYSTIPPPFLPHRQFLFILINDYGLGKYSGIGC